MSKETTIFLTRPSQFTAERKRTIGIALQGHPVYPCIYLYVYIARSGQIVWRIAGERTG